MKTFSNFEKEKRESVFTNSLSEICSMCSLNRAGNHVVCVEGFRGKRYESGVGNEIKSMSVVWGNSNDGSGTNLKLLDIANGHTIRIDASSSDYSSSIEEIKDLELLFMEVLTERLRGVLDNEILERRIAELELADVAPGIA